MTLPLERDQLLSRWEGWRDFAEAPPLEKPERLSLKQLNELGEDARIEYDYHRERYHANFLVKTPQVEKLNVRLWDLLDANQQGPSRVKGAAVVDSPPGLGKTTAVDAFGRAFHKRQIIRHGTDFDDGQTLHIPVCRVAFTGNTTTRALNEAILDFYNHPSADASKSRYLRNRSLATLAAESVRRHGTRLIIVDDVHFLKIHTDEGVALANELKWLANEYPATFLFTGVNMSDTGLLSESKTDRKLAMSQIARRWTRLTLPPFEHPVGEHRKSWVSILGTIESHLVLANARPRMLREQADYLFERSTGMIGSLFKLITLGAVHAMRDGAEALTRELLDEIDIDVAAEDAREVVARDSSRRSAVRPSGRSRTPRHDADTLSPSSRPGEIVKLRRLLHVAMPLPDEPLDSWVEFMAHSYGATVGEMARALGLIDTDGVPAATPQSARAWSTALEPQQLTNLELTTGRPADEYRAMTRTAFAANAIRFTPQGRISASCPSTGIAARYCPDCLADSGGRWRLSWQFPFGFACLRHKRLLVDLCPGCGQPPRLIGHPITLVPEPGHCHNRPSAGSPSIRERCGADLTAAEEFVAADDATRETQRMMLRVVAAGASDFGIYADARPSTIHILSDMLLLSRAGRQELVDGHRFEWMPASATTGEAITSHAGTGKVALRPSIAREVALGNTIAFEALRSVERVADVLRGRVSAHAALDHHSPPLRDHVSRALGRTRRPTATLQAMEVSAAKPESRAAKIPAVLWPEWTTRLAPRRLDAEIAGGALAAAVVFTGTRLTHGSAIKLLDPKMQGRQVSHVMRALGRNAPEADTIRAIARLAMFLDETSPPIDFARRRALDYSGILPRDEWHEICRTANVLPGGTRRWQLARAHLYALLSGNRLTRAPFAREDGFPSFAKTSHFRDALPGGVSVALREAAAGFLKAAGIDEPPSWTPSLEVAGVGSDLPEPNRSEWPRARPARASLEPSRAIAAHLAGRSVMEIAADHGVARQTVGRVLAEAGVETRRGRRRAAIDVGWLRQRYIVERRTIPEIAGEAGVTMTTINRHLEAAGIPRRPRGSASRSTAIRVDPRAGDSPLLGRALVGQGAVQRAERFLIVARHDTMTTAARELGVTLSILASQMKRLGAEAGGPLITRAVRGQPLELTELGVEVQRELTRVFAVSGAEGPARPTEESQ